MHLRVHLSSEATAGPCAPVRTVRVCTGSHGLAYLPLLRARGKGRSTQRFVEFLLCPEPFIPLTCQRTLGSDSCRHRARRRERSCGEGSSAADLGRSQSEPERLWLLSPCSAPLHRGGHRGGQQGRGTGCGARELLTSLEDLLLAYPPPSYWLPLPGAQGPLWERSQGWHVGPSCTYAPSSI